MTQSPEAAMRTRAFCDEHAAALRRYAPRRTRDGGHAEDVVHETLVSASLHAEVVKDSERSPRDGLFTVARNMIGDEVQLVTQRRRDYDSTEILEHGRGADD